MSEERAMLPAHVRPYKKSAVFDETTMPAALRRRHCARPAQMHEVEPLGPVRFFVEFHSAGAATGESGAEEPEGCSRHG